MSEEPTPAPHKRTRRASEPQPRPRRRLVDRPTIDLMILTFTLIVAVSIMATGATIAIIEIRDPSADTSKVQDSLTSVITAILGALLGLIAGKSSSAPPS